MSSSIAAGSGGELGGAAGLGGSAGAALGLLDFWGDAPSDLILILEERLLLGCSSEPLCLLRAHPEVCERVTTFSSSSEEESDIDS